MAKRRQERVRLDDVVREMVELVVDARLQRLTGGGSLSRRLRGLELGLQRIERRIERLAKTVSRRPRKGSGRRPGRPALYETCQVDGCEAEHYAHGLCSRHYQQHRRGRTDLAEIVERAKAAARKAKGAQNPTSGRSKGKAAKKKVRAKKASSRRTGSRAARSRKTSP